MEITVQKAARLRGTVKVPGDKSISHRALLLGALAQGETTIEGFLPAQDCWSTVGCLEALGVEIIRKSGTCLVVRGAGRYGLREPESVLEAGNSGTTMRLLLGVLAGQPFYAVINGDASLRRRPMDRVVEPLTRMGARIWGRSGGRFAPLSIQGTADLRPLSYRLPVASAQVKSALLLAGLQAEGITSIVEPAPTRDHTERMLRDFGVEVRTEPGYIEVMGPCSLRGTAIDVPGDFSAAAFFLVAALIVPGSEVLLLDVGVNPTRTGLLEVLKDMGADIQVGPVRYRGSEPAADLLVRHSPLRSSEVGGDLIPRLIDEVPILAVAATQAEGTTIIRDAAELTVKESNRLKAMAEELTRLGARAEATEDKLVIEGPARLRGARCQSHGDHRVAMALAVAGLVAEGSTTIEGAECIAISFPDFLDKLGTLVSGYGKNQG